MNRTPIYLLPLLIAMILMMVQMGFFAYEAQNQVAFNKYASDYCRYLSDKLAQLEAKNGVVESHVFMMGVMHNDNFAAVSRGDKEFIYINNDWTINQLPRYVKLTAADREALQKMVRPGAPQIKERVQRDPNVRRELQQFVQRERPRVFFPRIRAFFGRLGGRFGCR